MSLKNIYLYVEQETKSTLSKFANFISNNFLEIIIVCLFLFFLMFLSPAQLEDKKILATTRGYIITVYGVLVGILMTFVVSKVIQLRQERFDIFKNLDNYTQKLHKFRYIINKLLTSGFFSHSDINKFKCKHPKLSYFDIQDILDPDKEINKRAKLFFGDKEKIGFENFYLELSSFIHPGTFDITIYTTFNAAKYYSIDILQKWIENDCGNGFWYYLENQKSEIEGLVHLNSINENIKKEIKDLSLKIDHNLYRNMDFDEQFLIMLGNQAREDIIPNVYRLQKSLNDGLPNILQKIILLITILIIFGIILPILSMLFNLLWFDTISISMLLCICLYIILSIRKILNMELDINKVNYK